ncbi:four helix bundle protein [Mesotoga sp.]|uniref:four helix bundle protein n=1 Tax=Mesotoga sp. TaxID=2053577 RepID=UPI00345E5FE6
MKFAYDVYQIVSTFLTSKFGPIFTAKENTVISFPLMSHRRRSRPSVQKGVCAVLFLAKGSLREAMTQLELSKMFEYIDEETFIQIKDQANRLHKMLNKLISRLKNPGG